mgnify:CR=1 FL=1
MISSLLGWSFISVGLRRPSSNNDDESDDTVAQKKVPKFMVAATSLINASKSRGLSAEPCGVAVSCDMQRVQILTLVYEIFIETSSSLCFAIGIYENFSLFRV